MKIYSYRNNTGVYINNGLLFLIMIKYNYFRYIFGRYLLYKLSYAIIFGTLPILGYIVVRLRFVLKNNDINENIQLILFHFREWNFYELSVKDFDSTDNLLILFWILLLFIYYVIFVNKVLNKVFFEKYKNILIITNIKKISWSSCVFFAIINSILSVTGATLVLLTIRCIMVNYTALLILAQAIGFIISCLINYLVLNKFVSHFCQVKIKPVPYNK